MAKTHDCAKTHRSTVSCPTWRMDTSGPARAGGLGSAGLAWRCCAATTTSSASPNGGWRSERNLSNGRARLGDDRALDVGGAIRVALGEAEPDSTGCQGPQRPLSGQGARPSSRDRSERARQILCRPLGQASPALLSPEMSRKVLHVRLPSSSVCPEQVEGNSSPFNYEGRVVAIGHQLRRHDVFRAFFLPHGHFQTPRKEHTSRFGPGRPTRCQRRSP